ncbi:MAG: DUF4388 domain-containing protein [Myxococcales bacterium]
MSFSGNLEDVSVADALQFIHLGARTGTLTLVSGDRKGGIGFHQGRIVNAWGPATKRLGDLLVENGTIDRPTLANALRRQQDEQPRRSLGQILVAEGGVTEDQMFRAVEQQIGKTVYDLVTWNSGTFHFVRDDVRPVDEISLDPADIVGRLNLDTQMVLLDALRLFDERNRDAGIDEPVDEITFRLAVSERVKTPAPMPVFATPAGVAPLKPRLQVISADRGLADRLGNALAPGEATVLRLTLREAGTPPPGEPAPIVLIDLRGGAIALESLQQLRKTRPRASILAVVDAGVPLARTYEAGAMAAVPPEISAIVAGFRSVVENRRDLMGGGRAERINANFAKLRRIVGDVRAGLISSSISLTLMNIISESVDRAVLFLVRRDSLAALGAFGNSNSGRPLAQLTRGMVLELEGQGALSHTVRDGLVHALKFDDAKLPVKFVEAIGTPRSGQCAVFPVLGGERAIAIIYADNGEKNRALEEMDILELAASQAGLAFENELLRRQVAPPGPA